VTEPGSSFGLVAGDVAIDGARTAFRTAGFADAAIGRPQPIPGAASLRLLVGFGDDAGYAVQVHDGAAGSIVPLGGRRPHGSSLDVPPWTGAFPDAASSRLELEPRGAPPLICRPRSRVALLRPLDAAGARYARISFGVADFEWGALGTGSGFFEHVEVQTAPASARGAAELGPAAG
jgi:hypothetical protein